MEPDHTDYYEYTDENQSFYDEEEDYESYDNYEDQIDFIIDQLKNHGCKHDFDDIEEFLFETDPNTLREWYLDLQDQSMASFTCTYIKRLITKQIRNQMSTPPAHNEITENLMSSHEEKSKEVLNDKNDKQVPEHQSILPPSNISYYDLSPYVNTAEVFSRNIISLKKKSGAF